MFFPKSRLWNLRYESRKYEHGKVRAMTTVRLVILIMVQGGASVKDGRGVAVLKRDRPPCTPRGWVPARNSRRFRPVYTYPLLSSHGIPPGLTWQAGVAPSAGCCIRTPFEYKVCWVTAVIGLPLDYGGGEPKTENGATCLLGETPRHTRSCR